MASEFESVRAEAGALSAELRELEGLADNFGRAMTSAFRRAVVDGKKLEDVLKSLALALSSRALSAALAPISRGLGNVIASILGGGRFAKGGILQSGGVRPFAAGGVVSTPSYFPMRRGLGLMGEAGPEAILPLQRSADGRLGVVASGGGASVNVVFNVTTPDASSFRKSEAQVTGMLARAVSRGTRTF